MSERTATEILLELEAKLDNIIKIIQNMDMNNKILSNKLNSLASKIGHNSDAPKFSVEVSNDDMLKTNATAPKINLSSKKIDRVSPLIKAQEKPIVAKPKAMQKNEGQEEFPEFVPEQKTEINNTVPVIQRVLDDKGTVLFMAEVKIFDGDKIIKTTTTKSSGKWNASLPAGKYKVIITKAASVSRPKLEEIQIITVEGNDKINNLGDFVLTQVGK